MTDPVSHDDAFPSHPFPSHSLNHNSLPSSESDTSQ